MGALTRVDGPLVEVSGLPAAAMFELVGLGPAGIPGEVVAIRGDRVTVQAYEYTGGLAPGEPAVAFGEPLSASLGPHLLGGVFDGLLRPLRRRNMAAGHAHPSSATDVDLRADSPAHGDEVGAGSPLGTVDGAGAVTYIVLSPVPGRVTAVRTPGSYDLTTPVATVGGQDVTLAG